MGRIEAVRRRLAEDLPRYAAAHGVPGASAAVLVDGQVIESATGVVNLRTGVSVTPDALFMIQSITKVWTATLVMQLVDEGLVALDTPVRAYLPEFRTADERASGQITVRHLLTHTGGFEGDIWAATTAGEDALERFVADLVSEAPQYAPPGEMYSYCSAGFGVLGRLVEVFRQMPYAEAFRRYLADPLGIGEIAFSADEALAYRTAIGHGRPSPDAAEQPLKVWASMPPSNPAAGNQLAMSARSLISFARMHLSDGRAADGTRLLSVASARAMRERHVDHPAATGSPAGHGLGWMLSSRPGLVEHAGGAIGVAALLRMVPERGVAVAILTNGEAGGQLIDDLLDPLLSELADVAPAPPLPSGDVGMGVPARYLGRYQTRIDRNDVTLDDGRLWLTNSARNEALDMIAIAGVTAEQQRYELRPVDGDTFVLIDSSGVASRAVEFWGADDAGRALFLNSGRAAPRIDAAVIP
ncbi:MAG TPA: serine hydrolase domain-containing protein [Mycobacteriales bacterium]|nr:serine hydrolase domain-containing protein [Mycobacteriales bacterium]